MINNNIWEQHVQHDGCFGHNRRVIVNSHIGIDMDYIPDGRVTKDKMPEQNEEMLGKEFLLLYYNKTHNGYREESDDGHMPITDYFKVIRWDNDKPFCILINDKKKLVIVSVPDHILDDGSGCLDSLCRRISNAYIHEIPVQNYDYLGLPTMGCYYDSEKNEGHNTGVIIRADSCGHDPHCIVLEECNGNLRVVSVREGFIYIQPTDIGPAEEYMKHDYWPKDWRNLNYEKNTDGEE